MIRRWPSGPNKRVPTPIMIALDGLTRFEPPCRLDGAEQPTSIARLSRAVPVVVHTGEPPRLQIEDGLSLDDLSEAEVDALIGGLDVSTRARSKGGRRAALGARLEGDQ